MSIPLVQTLETRGTQSKQTQVEQKAQSKQTGETQGSSSKIPMPRGLSRGGKILHTFMQAPAGQSAGGTSFLLRHFEHLIDVVLREKYCGSVVQGERHTEYTVLYIGLERPSRQTPFGKVPLRPMDAIIQKTSYAGELFCIVEKNNTEERKEKKYLSLGLFPVMIGCKYCHLYGLSPSEMVKAGTDWRDPLGYFIIEGTKRFMYSFSIMAVDKIICYKSTKVKTNAKTSIARISERWNCRIMYEDSCGITNQIKFTCDKSDKNTLPSFITYQLPYKRIRKTKEETFSLELNIMTIFDIYANIEEVKKPRIDSLKEKVKNALRLSIPNVNANECISLLENTMNEYLGVKAEINKMLMKVNNSGVDQYRNAFERLKDLAFPEHLLKGLDKVTANNRCFDVLIMMLSRMLMMMAGIIPDDDIDICVNKCFKTSSRIICDQINAYRPPNNINPEEEVKMQTLADFKLTLEGIASVILSTYGKEKIIAGRKNEMDIKRFEGSSNFTAMKGELLTIDAAVNSEIRKSEVRSVAKDSSMFIDANETVESKRSGLVRTLTIMGSISVGVDFDIRDVLLNDTLSNNERLINTERTEICSVPVLLNAFLIGYCSNPESVRNIIISKYRRTGRYRELSVSVMQNARKPVLTITTNSTRLLAPFLIVNPSGNLALNENLGQDKLEDLTFDDLLNRGIVEYLDPEESSYHDILVASQLEICENDYAIVKNSIDFRDSSMPDLVIPVFRKYSHAKITEYSSGGYAVCEIPWATNNLVDRIAGQIKKNTQATGIPDIYSDIVLATKTSTLMYPQAAITSSELTNITGILPIGQHFHVAFMADVSENMDDAVIVNERFIQLGGMRTNKLLTVTCELPKNVGSMTQFKKPRSRDEKFKHLDENGLPIIGTLVKKGMFIACCTYMHTEGNTQKERIIPFKFKESNMAIVSSVIRTIPGNKEGDVSIQLRDLTIGNTGDKIVKSWSQKFTIRVAKNEDMPFDEEGNIIDMIVNPITIIGRGSLCWIWDVMLNLVAEKTGLFQECTTGVGFDETKAVEILQSFGYLWDATKRFKNGRTGNLINARILSGPSFIQINKHIAQTKVMVRGGGSKGATSIAGLPSPGPGLDEQSQKVQEALLQVLSTSGGSSFPKMSAASDAKTYQICSKCGGMDTRICVPTEILMNENYPVNIYCVVCGEGGSKIKDISLPSSFVHTSKLLKCFGLQLEVSQVDPIIAERSKLSIKTILNAYNTKF